jgi:hypothetical protein
MQNYTKNVNTHSHQYVIYEKRPLFSTGYAYWGYFTLPWQNGSTSPEMDFPYNIDKNNGEQGTDIQIIRSSIVCNGEAGLIIR